MVISEIAKNLGSRDLMRPFDANICVSLAANELLNALKASGLSIFPVGEKFIYFDGKKYSGLSSRGFEDAILMASEAIGVNRIFVRSEKFINSVRRYIKTINFDDYFPKKRKGFPYHWIFERCNRDQKRWKIEGVPTFCRYSS